MSIYNRFHGQMIDPQLRQSRSDIISDIGIVSGRSGSNNTTYVTTLAPYCSEPPGTKVLVRTSRNTYSSEHKITELHQSVMFMLDMSQKGVGPKIYDIQYMVDKKVMYVMELFDMDMRTYLHSLRDYPTLYPMVRKSLLTETQHILKTMSDMGMVCSDIKLENTVVRIGANNQPSLRFIDVDADFCKRLGNLHIDVSDIPPDMINADLERAAYIYMSYLFANHLFKAGINYLAPSNQTYQSDGRIPDMLKIINAIQPTFLSVMHHYFNHGDVTMFINNACSGKMNSSPQPTAPPQQPTAPPQQPTAPPQQPTAPPQQPTTPPPDMTQLPQANILQSLSQLSSDNSLMDSANFPFAFDP
jgi:hypothetical protein